jgi:predicted transcriptional regulator of viral defense system
VTTDQAAKLIGLPRASTGRMLARLAAKGWLYRVRRGVYTRVPLGAVSPQAGIEDPWLVAAALFAPGYVSGWSAAEHWDLTEQVFNAISVVTATPQRTKSQRHGGISFYVRTVKPTALFGTKKIWHGSSQVLVADPSRLVIDILNAPDLGGGTRHVLDVVRSYWRSQHASPDLLLGYAGKLGVGAVYKRLGFTAELFAQPADEWVARCRAGMSAGLSRLDPTGPNRGRVVTKWRLRINTPVEP